MRDGTAVLLHMQTKFYFTLNETGVFVWKLLSSSGAPGEGWARDAVATKLTEEFDVDLARATADLDALLDELRAEKLLLALAPGPASAAPRAR
jgi:Coenzyme PQQ synthesis protein D (PqqD)